VSDPINIVGKHVSVVGPHSSWEGRAVAYTDKPTYLIETETGQRLMLPAEWTTLANPKGTQ